MQDAVEALTADPRISAYPFLSSSFRGGSTPSARNLSETELRQWRSPLGGGPSLKTWPR